MRGKSVRDLRGEYSGQKEWNLQRPREQGKHDTLEKLKGSQTRLCLGSRRPPPTLEPNEKLTQETERNQRITFIAEKAGLENTKDCQDQNCMFNCKTELTVLIINTCLWLYKTEVFNLH